MSRIGAIASRDLRSLFVSPLAWTILGGVQFINAWMFLVLVEEFLLLQGRVIGIHGQVGVTDLVVGPVFRLAAVILIVVTPLLTMRALAEERRSGTLPLLLSAPVSLAEIVVGKYLAVLAFLLVSLCLTTAMPLALLAWTPIDLGKLGAGVLGVGLCAAAFTAAGLFTSSLTSQPGAAAFGAMGLLALFWLLDIGNGGAAGVLHHLSLSAHLDQLLRGVFSTADLTYFACFTLAFIILAIRRLDNERRSA